MENTEKIFYNFNNKILVIEKDKRETTEIFYFRVEFIINQIIKNKSDLEKYIEISYYLACKHFYGCEYEENKEIDKIINDYLAKKNF